MIEVPFLSHLKLFPFPPQRELREIDLYLYHQCLCGFLMFM